MGDSIIALNKLQNEFKAILNVLEARIDGAADAVDWSVINKQTQDLLRVGIKAKQTALEIERGL